MNLFHIERNPLNTARTSTVFGIWLAGSNLQYTTYIDTLLQPCQLLCNFFAIHSKQTQDF